MKHKIIPMIVCLMLCVALMPAAAYADNAKTTPAEPPGIWTDHAAAAFAGGSGTAEDPYQIATPQQMAKLAADINSGDESKKHSGEHFKLTADLNLSAHRWIPIGSGDLSLGIITFPGILMETARRSRVCMWMKVNLDFAGDFSGSSMDTRSSILPSKMLM